MRKLLSIVLLVVFGLPLILPLLASGQDTEAGLPACCRRNGKHHCMMSMNERAKLATDNSPQLRAPAEKCPYNPSVLAPTHPNSLAEPSLASAIFGGLVSHPTGFAQTEALRRISRDRSNQKRGPPSQTLL